MDYDYSKILSLDGSNKLMKEMYLICSSKLGDSFKNVLTISSPITIKNITSKDLILRIHAKPNYSNYQEEDKYYELSSKKQDIVAIPFDLIDSSIQFALSKDEDNFFTRKINENRKNKLFEYIYKKNEDGSLIVDKENGIPIYYDSWTDKIQLNELINLTSKDAPKPLVISKGTNNTKQKLNFVMYASRDKSSRQRLDLVILPYLKIRNCLPFPMKFQVIKNGQRGRKHVLFPTEEKVFTSIKYETFLEVRFKIPGFRWSEPQKLVKVQEDKEKNSELKGHNHKRYPYRLLESLEVPLVDDVNPDLTSGIKMIEISNGKKVKKDLKSSEELLDLQESRTALNNYLVYAQAIIINESQLDLEFYKWNHEKSSYSTKMAGQYHTDTGASKKTEFIHLKQVTLVKDSTQNFTAYLGKDFMNDKYPNMKHYKPVKCLPSKTCEFNDFSIKLVDKTYTQHKISKLKTYISDIKRPGILAENSRKLETPHTQYDLVIHEKSIRVHESFAEVTTTIYFIEPKNIFYNNTNKTIEIKQEDTDQEPLVIPPKKRKWFFWHDGSKHKDLQFRVKKGTVAEYPWSGSMSVTNYGIFSIMGFQRPEGVRRRLYYEYEVKKTEGLNFIYLKKQKKSEPLFRIVNFTSNMIVDCWQKNHE